MRACIQRVNQASVAVAGQTQSRIDRGLLVLLGVAEEDEESDSQWLAEKLVTLRVFDDDHGRMNRSLIDVQGAMLVVSQFTLLGDCKKGRRPNFVAAANPAKAEALYLSFVRLVASHGVQVETGRFRAHMEVSLVNDGPVTLVLDTRQLDLR